jgi:hypothetical protein
MYSPYGMQGPYVLCSTEINPRQADIFCAARVLSIDLILCYLYDDKVTWYHKPCERYLYTRLLGCKKCVDTFKNGCGYMPERISTWKSRLKYWSLCIRIFN